MLAGQTQEKNQTQHAALNTALSFGVAIGLDCATACAHADDAENTLKVGCAHIGFNTTSGDLIGPAGTTLRAFRPI